jgi:hypothetical protein
MFGDKINALESTTSSRRITKVSRKPVEARRHPRTAVFVELRARVQGKVRPVSRVTDIVNFSRGGICIEWDACPECKGYQPGGVHPDCIFSAYDNSVAGSDELDFCINNPYLDGMIVFKGKVAHVTREGCRETVGIAFASISPEMMGLLEEIICPGKIRRSS